jgi:hypothetical protein
MMRAVDLMIRRPRVVWGGGVGALRTVARAPLALLAFAAAVGATSISARAQDALLVRASPQAPWRPLWRGRAAPARWAVGDRSLQQVVRWRRAAPGIAVATLAAASGDAHAAPRRGLAFEFMVVRIETAQVRVQLHLARGVDGQTEPWDIMRAPARALVALNAGQFTDDGPWGWIVYNGRELQAPGSGALAGALVVDSAGRASLMDPASVDSVRARSAVRWAVQSYPALLTGDGVVPEPLRADARGVDRTHRDTRLALGQQRDGALLIVLSRYRSLGRVAERAPIGPTTPEMAALLGALGAQRALMLDGGLSAQLLVRAPDRTEQWPGLRSVPLGLIVMPER